MKKIFALLVIVFVAVPFVFAEDTTGVPVDTAFFNKKIADINNKFKILHDSIDATRKEIRDSLQSGFAKECGCVQNIQDIKDGMQWFIILSPFYLLIVIIIILVVCLWKKFNFTEALTENEPPKKVIKNPEYSSEVIAANSGLSNLSVLLPTTIEVSNIDPSLFELREISARKAKYVLAVEASRNAAQSNEAALAKKVEEAQSELDKANASTESLTQAVSGANAALATAKSTDPSVPADIAKAQTTADDAQKALDENNKAVELATSNLATAKKAVLDNRVNITNLEVLLQKAKAEAEDVKEDVEMAEAAAKDNMRSVYSTGTYRASISRYIAFITSMVTILLVVCMSSFFIYHYMKTSCPPDFGALTTVLIALGLGVTPYLVNRVSAASAANKS